MTGSGRHLYYLQEQGFADFGIRNMNRTCVPPFGLSRALRFAYPYIVCHAEPRSIALRAEEDVGATGRYLMA